ncbi:MAG: sigma 54-interacting transcriptional regulator [Desulfobacteraceae bacterium]
MILSSLRNKLALSVSALVIASGLVISILETNRFSTDLLDAAVQQGENLSQSLALEATNKILINDLASLQNLLNHQMGSNPSLAYLFIMQEGQILAHTFAEGMPVDLINVNIPQSQLRGNHRRIIDDRGDYYLDIAWPIFSGKAGILRLGLSEKPFRSKTIRLWLHMTATTLVILILAIVFSLLFIQRITRPLTALAAAAENIDEKNLEPIPDTQTSDEVGRLTSSINKMLARIKTYTNRLEQHTRQLDRAHRQTKNAFEIISTIWRKDRLEDVSAYLIWKLREIVACKDIMLFIFNHHRNKIFFYFDDEFHTLAEKEFTAAYSMLNNLDRFSFQKNDPIASIAPEVFEAAKHAATFPILHEGQPMGVLLIPCPGQCQCNAQALEVIGLILNHSAGAIKRAATHEEEMQNLRIRLAQTKKFCGIVGKDPMMEAIYKLIQDIAPSDTTVLIQGDSGTGKELVAQAIHQSSPRRDKPFVVINCSAYPPTLLESELFGHEKGAFTGAVRRKTGRFEKAHTGTVFLDEIGEIPASAQVKLLRVLQTQAFERVGGERTLTVDVRILAATNKDLLKLVKQGRFREDLYYRLNVIPIKLPPLSERRNDIALLARYFMHRFATEQGKEITDFSSEAMRMLLEYDWPGNVRELENCVEHTVVLAKGKRIEVADLPSILYHAPKVGKTASHGKVLQQSEANLLVKALENTGWNKKQAAKELGISRNTLYRKLKKYDIRPSDNR